MQFGGLDRAIFALYLSDEVQDGLGDARSWEEILKQIRIAKAHYPDMPLALEGGRVLGSAELTIAMRLKALKDARIRYLTLVHNYNNLLAGSSMGSQRQGLTRLGRATIEECHFHEILVDVSHASDETLADVLAFGGAPVIASHSGARAITRHPRNLSDMQIAQIAAVGGVICVPFARKFVGTRAGVAHHIDHIISVTGSVDHVGIGSDLDGAQMVPGVNGAEDWSKVVVDELQRRGIADEAIVQVAGGNLQRLLSTAGKEL